MSILIKGMEMPEYRNIYSDGCATTVYLCMLSVNKDGSAFLYCNDSNKEYCTVREISEPHGRLIDADELYEQFINEFCNMNCYESVRGEICDRCGVLRAINMIKSAPTIIEAENSSAIDDDVKKYCDYLKSETYDFCNRIENGEVSEE